MRTSEYVGWRFILAPIAGTRLLCFDYPEGDAAEILSPVVGEIVVIRSDSSGFPNPCMDAENGNIQYVSLDATACCRLPFPDDSFDGAVIIDGTWVYRAHGYATQSGARPLESGLLQDLHRVIRDRGNLFVVMPNKRHFSNLRGLIPRGVSAEASQTKGCPSPKQSTKALESAGFDDITTFRMLSSDGVIEELLHGGQYRPAKNAFASKQKLKAALLNSPLAGYFAQSLGFLATKGIRRRSFLDDLLARMCDDKRIFPASDKSIALRRYLILPGKVILSFGDISRRYGERIVVLPLASAVAARLRDETSTLEALQSTTLGIRTMVPKPFGEYELHGQAYFVQQELPGTSFDIPTPALEGMTVQAAGIVTRFHQQTAREVVIDSGILEELISKPLRRILESFGSDCSETVARIEMIANSALPGSPFKLVWMHGDFKIENLLFDPDDLQITGVIDWDLSRQDGFPLGDILYLLAYNRVIRNGGEVEEVILDCLIPRRLSGNEAAVLEAYMAALGIGNDQFDVLMVMFCIHHLAYRRDARHCSTATMAKMQLMLAASERLMACKYVSGSLQ